MLLFHIYFIQINSETKKLPFSSFYIDELSEKMNIRDAYVRWVYVKRVSFFKTCSEFVISDFFVTFKDDPGTSFSICNYPFVFNAAVKTMLLEIDTSVQIQVHKVDPF